MFIHTDVLFKEFRSNDTVSHVHIKNMKNGSLEESPKWFTVRVVTKFLDNREVVTQWFENLETGRALMFHCRVTRKVH